MTKKDNISRGLVSVIITTYKRPSSLKRAIYSVLRQTYQHIEIIIVDDNNEGDEFRRETVLLMDHFKVYKSVKYITHKKNMNGATARNTGIDLSKGKFITFLDDDDFFMPDRIEKLVNILDQNPTVGCVYSSVAFLYKNKLVGIMKSVTYNDYAQELLSQNSFFGTGSNFICRATIVRDIKGFDTRFIRHQDTEFMIRVIKQSKLIGVNDILVVKCMDSIINMPNPEKLMGVKYLFLSKFKNYINAYPKDIRDSIKYKNYFEVAKAFAMNGIRYGDEVGLLLQRYGGIDTRARLALFVNRLVAGKVFFKRLKYFFKRLSVELLYRQESIRVYSVLSVLDKIVVKDLL